MARTAEACGRISSNIIAIAASPRCSSATRSASTTRPSRRQGSVSISSSEYHDFRRLEMSLLGAFQFNNAAIAVTLFLLWLQRDAAAQGARPDRSRDTLRPARRALARPARDHRARSAHRDRRRPHPRRHPAIAGQPAGDPWRATAGFSSTGVSSDKKADEIVGALAPSFDTIICTAAHHKGADAEAHRRRGAARPIREADVHVAATIEDAVRLSQEMAATLNRRVYVAGGLFLAIEYATVAKGDRAEDLKFF